jgi:hypothetical protein
MSMFCGDNLLASISQLLLIPDDTLQKSLERTWRNIAIQSDRFRVLALYAGEQPLNVNPQQFSTGWPSKTICKLSQKPGEQFAKLCDILYRHGATFRGFLVKLFLAHGGSSLFALHVNTNNSMTRNDLHQSDNQDLALSR